MTRIPVNTGLQPFRQEIGTARNGITVPVPAVPPPYRAERHRNPGTNTPLWLADKINTSRRTARPKPCPRCGADLLVGDDDDRCAMVARVDPEPVGLLVEVAALLAGRESYDLIRGALHHREPHHHHSPARRWPVLLEHDCPEGTRR